MPPTSRAPRAATFVAACLAGMLLLPGVASAQEASAGDDDGIENDEGTPEDGTDETGDGTDGTDDDTDEPDTDDDSVSRSPRSTRPAPGTAPLPPDACTPHLVTFTRDLTDGDDAAVAITSQAIDTEVAGWLNVSWEAAAGTELTAIELTSPDGTRTTLPVTTTGTAYEVQSLRFCGTASTDDGTNEGDPAGPADPDDPTTDDDATDSDPAGPADPADPATDDGTPEGDPVDADGPATGDGTIDGDPADPADQTTDDDAAGADAEDAAAEAATTDDSATAQAAQPSTNAPAPSRAPATGDAQTETDADGDEEEDVEVLGVQIVAPPRSSADGTDAAEEGSDDTADAGDDGEDEPTTLAATPAEADPGGTPGGLSWLLLAAAVAAALVAMVVVLRGPGRAAATAQPTRGTGTSGTADTTT